MDIEATAPQARPKAFAAAMKDAGLGIITKAEGLHVKAIREATREVDFVASTDALDSHGEIIDQSSWRLEQFRANPVILYGHQAYELPIGQATAVEVRSGRLEVTIKFSDATERAEEVWKLVKEKTLRAVSVGFMPTDGRYELRNGEDVWVWYGPVLKEVSVVAVPANYEALAKIKAAFKAAEPGDLSRSPNPTPAENGNGTKAGTDERNTTMDIAKQLEETKAAHKETTEKLAAVNVKLVETEQRAEKAEAKLTVAEKALEETKATVAKLEAEAKVRETEHAKACAERDTATKRADEAEEKLIELEVDAIVGVKIAPTEKADFVALRKSNPTLFKSMVEKRADMKLVERVTEPDEKAKEAKPTLESAGNAEKGAVDIWNAC